MIRSLFVAVMLFYAVFRMPAGERSPCQIEIRGTPEGGMSGWSAAHDRSSTLEFSDGGRVVFSMRPGIFEKGWRAGSVTPHPDGADAAHGEARSVVSAPSGGKVELVSTVSETDGGGLKLAYSFKFLDDLELNSLYVTLELPLKAAIGGSWETNSRKGVFPAVPGSANLDAGVFREVRLILASEEEILISFPVDTPVLLQDNRQWQGTTFSVRIGPGGDVQGWSAGDTLDIAMELSSEMGIRARTDSPVKIIAGNDWLPFKPDLEIEEGSVLDFSKMGHLDAPAGRHGWLRAAEDGNFIFEGSPGEPKRFYGVNLSFSAQYMSHDEADKLAVRFARLGYNTVRLHHHESQLFSLHSEGIGGDHALDKPNQEKLDQLDYFFAALSRLGIYITTDLYVSRRVQASEIWPGEKGDIKMDDFKMLVVVNPAARENLKRFTRKLIGRENPYTGKTWAQDPALAWISIVNENNPGNFVSGLSGRVEREWRGKWNEWLAAKYADTDKLAAAWAENVQGNIADKTVAMPQNVYHDSRRNRDFALFCAAIQLDMFENFASFLKEELGSQALLTDLNGWTNNIPLMMTRKAFDYVDEHFYVDHPVFIENPWQLPSRSQNTSPVASGSPGGTGQAFVRIFGKPLAISEFNYSGPGRYRGVGGILTGSLAALQGWGAVWRYSYSHSREALFNPGGIGYFDLSSDPLSQAADRAAVCLFLRGDMSAAPNSVSIVAHENDLADTNENSLVPLGIVPPWRNLAWVTRTGYVLGEATKELTGIALPLSGGGRTPYPFDIHAGKQIVREMRDKGWLGEDNMTSLEEGILHSETQELLLHPKNDVMVLNTPRTAGCFARPGYSVRAGAAEFSASTAEATMWVSSVDGQPITRSRRLIVTHLTDIQNSGIRFAETSRRTLLDWGSPQLLVRKGEASVAVEAPGAKAVRAWRLAAGGRRLSEATVSLKQGRWTLHCAISEAQGAQILYEVEVDF